MVILKLVGVPIQVLAIGVTFTVPTATLGVTGFNPGKEAILPAPVAASPILSPVVVHVKVSPGEGHPVKLIAGTLSPAQTVMGETGVTVGVG
jgi:hypothetical protein